MRNNHVFQPLSRYPTAAEIEVLMRRARRMRSEAVHAYLARFWQVLIEAIKPKRAAQTTIEGNPPANPQCC